MSAPDSKRQVIVTVYTPEEKIPPDGLFVIATISGCDGRYKNFDHCLAIAEYYADEGWFVEGIDTDVPGAWLKVHAWCDLEPYKGE